MAVKEFEFVLFWFFCFTHTDALLAFTFNFNISIGLKYLVATDFLITFIESDERIYTVLFNVISLLYLQYSITLIIKRLRVCARKYRFHQLLSVSTVGLCNLQKYFIWWNCSGHWKEISWLLSLWNLNDFSGKVKGIYLSKFKWDEIRQQ